eukprot:TRINITY_DN91507_c0_g1_i1.p1 TRINITY_DN91507_c0_g1~~TRINITY_DN91507_c0_g1_i1.p1  ORF type:complete len:358 (+),score=33.67 TRINITY_DN91507_c0_g1_i1:90-1076(+)
MTVDDKASADALKVALIQLSLPTVATSEEKKTAVLRAAELIRRAPAADVYVLPELAPVGYTEEAFAARANLAEDEKCAHEQTSSCLSLLAGVAKERGAYVCYGVPGHAKTADGRDCYAIRYVVLDDFGRLVTSYDKIHLCDYGECAETRFFSPGRRLAYFECRGWKLGIQVCADMRYTELSRELTVGRGCDIIIHPVAFAQDCSYATWRSFVECRALENQVYWASVNYAGEHFGGSMWCPPWIDGDEKRLHRLGSEEKVQVFTATRSELNAARGEFAFRRLRKDRKGYEEPWHLRGLDGTKAEEEREQPNTKCRRITNVVRHLSAYPP